MKLDPIHFAFGGVLITAIVGAFGGIMLSRRPGQSFLRTSLLLFACGSGFATITLLLLQLYSAVFTDDRAIPSIERIGVITAIIAAGSLIACVVVFITACVTAFIQRRHTPSKPNDA